MNHNVIFSVLVFLLCIYHYCFGAVGCMERSWHTKKSYDYKSFHYATSTTDPKDSEATHCLCPCDKYISQYGKQNHRGKCPVCKHYRIPQSVIIVNNALYQYDQYKKTRSNDISNANTLNNTQKNSRGHNVKNVMGLWQKLTAHPKSTAEIRNIKS